MTGLGKILFQYLNDVREDIINITKQEFCACAINEERLKYIENRQQYCACINEILNLELQNITDYYEGKENG